MAKAPKSKKRINSNALSVASNKKPSDKKKTPRVKAKAKVSPLGGTNPTPCDCPNPCANLTTGETGLLWCDGSGQVSVLVFGGGDKILGWDSNGPYWKNP